MTDNEIAIRDQWIRNQLSAIGESVSVIEEVQRAGKCYVLAVTTPGGRYFFKECEPILKHEPALTKALAGWFPVDMPRVIGIDEARRWLLTADAGPDVRALMKADGDVNRWEAILSRFAALQQATVPYAEQLIALGVPDRRLDKLPAIYDELAADADALLIGQQDGLSEADLERLRHFRPEVERLCEALGGYNLPPTLHHDDFHVGNVGVLDGHYRFFDWGESCIAHPFYSLVIPIRYAKYIFKQEQPFLDHLRDLYLSAWTAYEPMERLYEALQLSSQLMALCRTMTWRQLAKDADEAYHAEIADTVPYWTLTFLNNTPWDL